MMDKPNKTVIEDVSINKLEDAVLRTGVVEPDVHKNDKTPSWDGEFRLYKSRESFSKDSLIGRIPVQVKGTWVERFQKNKAVFQADVSDLRNYLNDGGAVFFLIQIKDFDNYKIYYTSLLPFDLRRMLEKAGDQKTKQIKLELFPYKYRDGILRIFSDFLTNKKMQAKLLPDIRSMKDLEQSKMDIERFEFSIPRIGIQNQDDIFDVILNSSPYIYAKPRNVETSFVVDRMRAEQITAYKNTPIEINGEVLYDHIDIVHDAAGGKRFNIGTNIVVTLCDKRLHINYSFKGTLHEQICELKLLVALTQGQEAKVGKRLIRGTDFKLTGYTLEEMSDRLSGLLTIDRVLTNLHVKKDLDLGRLSDSDLENLNLLVNGLLQGAPVPFDVDGKPGVGTLTIGNITLLLSSKKNPNGSGLLISDFFEKDDVVLVENGMTPEKGSTVSPYIMMSVHSFETIDNADLSEIVPSIKKHPYSDLYGERIILLVLELLKLYDRRRDNKILDVVIQLLDFLQENDSSQEELYQINRLQTEKRRRKLTKQEIQYLVSMKSSGIPLQYQLAANILLDSFQEAQLIYEKLDKPEQDEFDMYPIKNLWSE